MALVVIFGTLAVLSIVLLAWQTIAASRFPLGRHIADASFAPAVTLLKPLKGVDEHTRDCLESWLRQNYAGQVQLLFGVAEADDPVCAVVRELLAAFPHLDAELVITSERVGPNAKVANVAQLARRAKHDIICVSDADVRITPDFLANAVAPLRDERVGLVTSFYQLANPTTFAMQIEAIAINADFWSQVLQSNTLKAQDFALGAVMVVRKSELDRIGGFESLADYLADDYQLGNRIARNGSRVELCPSVVECWDAPMNFRQVWSHQLRWARTIRVSQPLPYFFSILSNVTLWSSAFALSAAWLGVVRVAPGFPWHVNVPWLLICSLMWLTCLAARIGAAQSLVRRLTGRRLGAAGYLAVIAKDVVHTGIWAAAFLGNKVTWRGRTFRVQRGGKLVEVKPPH